MAGFGKQKEEKKRTPQGMTEKYGAALYEKGVNYHVRGDLLNAEKTYKEAIDSGYLHPSVFLNLGVIYKNSERKEKAIALYEKAIEIRPNNPSAYANLGNLYRELGNPEQALALTLKSLDLKPDSSVVHMNLGGIYKQLGQLDQALASMLKSLEHNPDNGDAYMSLSGIYKDLGQLDQALASMLKSLELKPDSSTAHMNLGVIYKDLGQLDHALASTLKSLELKPDNPNAHINLGAIYQDLGQLSKAFTSATTSLKLDSRNFKIYNLLSSLHLAVGNFEQAQSLIKKAIGLKPTDSDAHEIQGLICLELGQLAQAENEFRKALLFQSKNAAYCHRNLSLILCAKGDIELARQSHKDAIALDPLSKENRLISHIFAYKDHAAKFIENKDFDERFNINKSIDFPIILNRAVEPDLLKSLYELKARDLNQMHEPTYGDAIGSDYNFFIDNKVESQKLERDLRYFAQSALKSDVCFYESFYTILSGSSVVKRHNHITRLDKLKGLGLSARKYALVYYLKIGDQDCSDPGTLNLHDLDISILPSEGMIVIFPATVYHSVKYTGKKHRVIVGVNFYSI